MFLALSAFADVAIAMTRIQLAPTGLGTQYDDMGQSVSLFGDTAVVGAPNTQIAPNYNSGVVDVYRLDGGVWQSEAILFADDATPGMAFGYTLALGQDLLVIGASTGIYTFERNGSTWTQVDEFVPASGGAIALSGNTLVSASSIYVRAGDGWQLQAQLVGDDFGETLGESVAIDGDLLAITSVTRVLHISGRHVYFFSRSGSTWTREAKFELDSNPLGLFSSVVALSGQTAIVGNTPDEVDTVRVFGRNNDGTWSDQGILDAGTDLLWQDALSIDGDRALISGGDGTAYTFVRSNGIWTRDLHFSDPSYANCFASVSLEGTTALVGCPGAVTASGSFGKVDIFSLDSDPPTITAQFDQGNAHAGLGFGTRVSLSGDTLVVAATNGAYVFDNSGGNWVQQAQILSGPQVSGRPALDGDTVAVGYYVLLGAGSVDILTRTDGAWTLQTTLSGSGSVDSRYGAALALEGDTLVVGDPDLESCHLFQRSGSTWSETGTLQADDTVEGDGFCSFVSLSNDTLLVSAPYSSVGLETAAGAVYAFLRSQGTWTQQALMLAPVPAVNAEFGRSLDLKGDTAAIGAGVVYGDRGAAYVYERTGDIWSWQATLTPPLAPPVPGDYSVSVAVSDTQDTVIVGDTKGTPEDMLAGVAFVFARDGGQWSYTSTMQASPPFPRSTYDQFGISVAFSGEDFTIGAPTDGFGGAVYQGSLAATIFSDGFDPSP